VTRIQLAGGEWEFIGPYLPIGEYGPYPERLRQQFGGVIWGFKTGGQWREMPREFGAWSTVSNRFRQWRDAGVFEAVLEGLIAEAAKRCRCQEPRPCWSRRALVLVRDSAEAVASVDVEAGEPVGFGDQFRRGTL
jgi:transposase